MMKLAHIIWSVAATTLAGIFILIVLIVPSLAENDAKLILPAAVLGALLAIPISYFITKKITQEMNKTS